MKKQRAVSKALLLGLCLLLIGGLAYAQSPTGNIFGTIVDSDGQPLPGVTVTLTGVGAEKTQITDAQGQFRFLGLDPGSYSVLAELEGFGGIQYPDIEVRVSRNTTVPLTLTPAVTEVVTVTSESPLLDERKLQQGTTVSQVELEKIPTARDPWAILNQTPGVLVDRINVGGNESGQQAAFRAQAVASDENDFMVDGVQITDMRAIGASSTYYDFDQFAEMQFTTGGTDVTKNTAGVGVNLVTKRGSNEFRGSARFYGTKADGYFGGGLDQADVNVDQSDLPSSSLCEGCNTQYLPENDPGDVSAARIYQGAEIREVEDLGFEAGGAVVRDRLWLWGSWGQNDIQQNAASGTADDTILENQSLKLNAQLTDSNSAVGSWNNGDKQKFGRGASISRPDETTWNQRGPTAVYRAEDTHVFSNNLFVTGTWSHLDAGFQLAARGGVGPDAPESWIDEDGIWHDSYLSGAASNPSDEYKLDGSYFFNTGNANHELKIGGRFREFESSSAFRWPGRDVFTDSSDGETTFFVAHRGIAPPVTLEYFSLWAQDTVTFGRFTVNLGLRFDDQSGVNEAALIPANPAVPNVLPAIDFPGFSEEFDWTTIHPRVGFTYALGENRDTLVRASFAQFAEALSVGNVNRTNPAGDAYAYFELPFENAPYTGATDILNDPSSLFFAFPNGFDPANPTSLADPDVNDPGLDPSVTNELVFNVEHALLPEFVIGFTGTYRLVEDILETRDFIRDTVTGEVRTATVEDYVADGTFTGFVPGGITGGPASNVNVPLFALDPRFELTGGQLLLNGSREREYLGGAVTFTKRLANRWMLRGYINYGDAEWQIDDEYLFNNDPNANAITALYDGGEVDGDVFVERSAGSGKGERFLQSSWSYNLNGLYQVAPDRPWGFNLSAAVQGREGYAIPYAGSVTGSDGIARTIRAAEFSDDYRLDDVVTADVRVEKEFALTSAVNFTFGIDVFNVTNEGTELSRLRSITSGSRFFLNDNISPRIYRLGVRLGWK
ncbi:MAG TPA: TonB-dependent receptor [Thermoanaerobaculia bacterium]|nr:TonB-dependent receptor [Thermoanaerobaculia bacterium]